MASTNKTLNLQLSQYVGSDKPSFLGDYNSDMEKIDLHVSQTKADIEVLKDTTESQELSITQVTQNVTSLGYAVNETKSDINTLEANYSNQASALSGLATRMDDVENNNTDVTVVEFNPVIYNGTTNITGVFTHLKGYAVKTGKKVSILINAHHEFGATGYSNRLRIGNIPFVNDIPVGDYIYGGFKGSSSSFVTGAENTPVIPYNVILFKDEFEGLGKVFELKTSYGENVNIIGYATVLGQFEINFVVA